MVRRFLILFLLVLAFSLAETTKESIKIASWNIRILSNSRSDDELRSICKIAKEFDFISILELRDEAILKRMVAMLHNEFGRTYAYELSSPVGGNGSRRESGTELYAFFYDPKLISLVKQGSIFYDETFFRCPYYATFKAGNFDFTIICIHVIWGNTVSQRRKEINRLAHVYNTVQANDPVENDIILVGDFNRNPSDDLAWGPVKAITGMVHLFDLPEKSMIWDSELYDNIWFQGTYTKEFTLDRGIVHFDESDFGNDDSAASLAVSDHRPIWGIFRITTQDDD